MYTSFSPLAFLAILIAASTASSTSRLQSLSFLSLAPKVLVVITLTPLSIYSLCISSIISGDFIFNISGFSPIFNPFF